MKCKNCSNYNDNTKECDNGHDRNNCLFFKDIICDIHEKDIQDIQRYVEYYTRYKEE